MKFTEALPHLLHLGEKIRRAYWHKDWYITVKDGDIVDSTDSDRYFNADDLDASDWEIFTVTDPCTFTEMVERARADKGSVWWSPSTTLRVTWRGRGLRFSASNGALITVTADVLDATDWQRQ